MKPGLSPTERRHHWVMRLMRASDAINIPHDSVNADYVVRILTQKASGGASEAAMRNRYAEMNSYCIARLREPVFLRRFDCICRSIIEHEYHTF